MQYHYRSGLKPNFEGEHSRRTFYEKLRFRVMLPYRDIFTPRIAKKTWENWLKLRLPEYVKDFRAWQYGQPSVFHDVDYGHIHPYSEEKLSQVIKTYSL